MHLIEYSSFFTFAEVLHLSLPSILVFTRSI